MFVSTNNVILTPGNAQGVIPKELFSRVVRLRRDISKPVVANEAEVPTGASTTEGGNQQGTQRSKRDRKNREKPRFIEEIIWEDGATVNPPRLIEPDVIR